MIFIYYVPGSFGSTVEYILKSFTEEYNLDDVEISRDGSMHGFDKSNHLYNDSSYIDFFNNLPRDSTGIVTPVFPTLQGTDLNTLIKIAKSYYQDTDKLLLLYLDEYEYAEINRLFQYHKIINGSVYNQGLAGNVFGDFQKNIVRWNSSYQKVTDMQLWEFREWQSLVDLDYQLVTESSIPDNFLKISTRELLSNTGKVFKKIIQWSGLTSNSKDLDNFASEWRRRQQYVLDEHKLIVDIVDATINNISMPIPNDLNIFAQAIIQKRLRKAGYELKCDGLNDFPTDTAKLYTLLDTNLILHTKDLQ